MLLYYCITYIVITLVPGIRHSSHGTQKNLFILVRSITPGTFRKVRHMIRLGSDGGTEDSSLINWSHDERFNYVIMKRIDGVVMYQIIVDTSCG